MSGSYCTGKSGKVSAPPTRRTRPTTGAPKRKRKRTRRSRARFISTTTTTVTSTRTSTTTDGQLGGLVAGPSRRADASSPTVLVLFYPERSGAHDHPLTVVPLTDVTLPHVLAMLCDLAEAPAGTPILTIAAATTTTNSSAASVGPSAPPAVVAHPVVKCYVCAADSWTAVADTLSVPLLNLTETTFRYAAPVDTGRLRRLVGPVDMRQAVHHLCARINAAAERTATGGRRDACGSGVTTTTSIVDRVYECAASLCDMADQCKSADVAHRMGVRCVAAHALISFRHSQMAKEMGRVRRLKTPATAIGLEAVVLDYVKERDRVLCARAHRIYSAIIATSSLAEAAKAKPAAAASRAHSATCS